MKILFNKSNNGQAEIKLTLGFLDADFTYKNIEPDLKLNTPYLIDLIGKDVYNKIADLYDETDDFDDDEEYKALEERLIALSQLYIASFAYLDFAPNNDLSHSNSGRQSRTEENDKAPAFGQLKDDESATRKRAYKALDQIFTILEGKNCLNVSITVYKLYFSSRNISEAKKMLFLSTKSIKNFPIM